MPALRWHSVHVSTIRGELEKTAGLMVEETGEDGGANGGGGVGRGGMGGGWLEGGDWLGPRL